jgi:hypothetical protein
MFFIFILIIYAISLFFIFLSIIICLFLELITLCNLLVDLYYQAL